MDSKLTAVGTVSDLLFYPVKSLGVLKTNHVKCEEQAMMLPGLDIYDRQYAVLRPNGKIATIRDYSRMTLIKPSIQDGRLQFTAPEMSPLSIEEIPSSSQVTSFSCIDQSSEGIDCGNEASDWLSKFLNKPDLRLVCYNRVSNPRNINTGYQINMDNGVQPPPENPRLTYQDLAPYTLISQASIEDLNTHLETGVSILNFRMNIIVQGSNPYEEDQWDKLKIGTAEFRVYGQDPRCTLTTVDPVTGKRHPRLDPWRTMKTFRPRIGKGQSPCFGVYMLLVKPGEIHAGDTVYASTK